MKNLVYLFELDSVRNSDVEIEIGQKALFNEIIGKGNTVVLTFNQLVDSRGFFSLLDDKKIYNGKSYYENIISLFEKGAIKLSQYGDTRTITQYLINSLSYERNFIFSGWPLKSTQKRLLALIKRSLIYSDLTELNSYLNGNRSDTEIRELFIEVTPKKECVETKIPFENCKNILENLFWLLKTVLQLSFMHNIYNPPKPSDEYNMNLPKFICCALKLNPIKDDSLWKEARQIIINLKSIVERQNGNQEPVFDFKKTIGSLDRSDYHHALKKLYQESKTQNVLPFEYAEAIIDLCYNYQLEYSICNSSKHYNISELKSGVFKRDSSTFRSDFFSRLHKLWEINTNEKRFLLDESCEFNEYICPNNTILKLQSLAVRVASEYLNTNFSAYNDKKENIFRYEFNLNRQQKSQKRQLLTEVNKRLCLTIFCVIIACIVEIIFQYFQELTDEIIDLASWQWWIIETIVFLFATESITSLLSKRIKWILSLSDALGGMGKLIKDIYCFSRKRYSTYDNPNYSSIDEAEPYRQGQIIKYLLTPELKNYINLKKCNKKLFTPSSVYPIGDTDNLEILEELVKEEDLFNYHYGVQYRSKYNTFIVDPIQNESMVSDGKVSFFPYERVIPTKNNGVVIIARYNDQFVLLKQYRHATRKMHYSFPRGYGETNIKGVNNAIKELKEEIGARGISKPIEIGKVYPDTGLTSSCAQVFYIEIGGFDCKLKEEGITDICTFNKEEIEQLISSNINDCPDIIDDGFTLSAYKLYQSYQFKQ